jgi:hypothetical protein
MNWAKVVREILLIFKCVFIIFNQNTGEALRRCLLISFVHRSYLISQAAGFVFTCWLLTSKAYFNV